MDEPGPLPSGSAFWGRLEGEIDRALGRLAPTRATVTAISGANVGVADLAGNNLGIVAQLEDWRDLKVGDDVLLLAVPPRGQVGDIRPGAARFVAGVLRKGALSRPYDPLSGRDVIGWRGAATAPGKIHWSADLPAIYRANGSSWDPYGPLWALNPLPARGWAWTNQNIAQADHLGSMLHLYAPPTVNVHSLRIYDRAYGQGTVTAVALLRPVMSGKTNHGCGLVLRDPGSGKLISFGPAAGGNIAVTRWTNQTTLSAVASTIAWGGAFPPWWRVIDDGATLWFAVSESGGGFSFADNDWLPLYSETRVTFLTAPSRVGMMLNANNAAAPNIGMRLLVASWSQGA